MKKIMFNDNYGLTQAVLEGRKTMTRRIIKAPKTMEGQWVSGFAICKRPSSDEFVEVFALDADGGMINNILPKYKVGEVVAVAQNYNKVFDEFATIVYTQDKPVPDNFKAFGSHSYATLPRTMPGWDNKMFIRAGLMPHQIRITGVRVERLQDISDEDCLREGIQKMTFDTFSFDSWKFFVHNPREAFAALIDKVSGKGTWESNPWVFVYEFELLR